MVVHGTPGSGKSTQSARLAEEGIADKRVRHIHTRNLLHAVKEGEAVSKFSEYLSSPEAPSLPPDEIVNGIVFEAIAHSLDEDIILVDSYPTYADAIDLFCDTVRTNRHRLLGAAILSISLSTSIERARKRPARPGEDVPDYAEESYAAFRYNRDMHTTGMARLKFASLPIPIEEIEANGAEDAVYAQFAAAVGRLAMRNE